MIYMIRPQAYIAKMKKKLSLLLKEITTLEFLNPKTPIYTQKGLSLFWSKSLSIFFPNYKIRFHIRN